MQSQALRQFSDKGCLGGGLPVSFGLPTVLSSIALIVGFLVCVEYNDTAATDAHVEQYYMWYIHVSFMIFVGFGFLMTFLRRYSYSAVALNMFTSALLVLEFIWIGGAIQQLWSKEHGSDIRKIQLNLPLMIDSLFCAASGMIAFGAVLGKTTPTQLTLLLILFVPIYAVNQKLVFEYLKGMDIGGSLTIHVFGAYFGLVSSLVLGKRGTGAEHPKNGSSYTSDITSMIGTIFLFIYWPSFNGALASVSEEEGPPQTQFYCIVNTVTSLLGAIVIVFATSAIYEGKFNMMHIQNATLAGGVAMGSASNLKMQPGGALVIGMIAGVLSTTGFEYISPFLEKKIGLTDTCGVHNLHGMPGILGGLAAAAVSGIAYNQNAETLEAYRGSHSWSYQLASLATTLGMAIVGGVVCSLIVKMVTPADQELHGSHAFEDSFWWMAVEDEDSEAKAVDHEIIALSASKHCAMNSQHAQQSLYATPTTAPMGSHHSGTHQTVMGSHHDAHNHVIMSSRNTASNHPPSSPPSNRP